MRSEIDCEQLFFERRKFYYARPAKHAPGAYEKYYKHNKLKTSAFAFTYTGWSKSLCAPDDYIQKNPHTIDDLKMAITEYIRNVDRVILNTVFENTVRRVKKCQETGGGHFEHNL
jgi:hypothetical protein